MINKTIFNEKGTDQQSSKRVMGVFFGLLCAFMAVFGQVSDFKVDYQIWISMLAYSAVLLGVATWKSFSEFKKINKNENNN